MEDIVEYRVYYNTCLNGRETCSIPMDETSANHTYHELLRNKECYDVRLVREVVKREIIQPHLVH